jgi:hypothetical protein
LKIYRLKDEKYFEIEKDIALPVLSAEILTDFLKRFDDSDQFETLSEFEKWLDKQK